MNKLLISRLLIFLSPILRFVNHYFKVPFLEKAVTGVQYYRYRDLIKQGDTLLTMTKGYGTNLLNPSKINHAAMYFGKGLRTAISEKIEALQFQRSKISAPVKRKFLVDKINFFGEVINKCNIRDEVCYVIEATGKGVWPNDLVSFVTTKDYLECREPKFLSEGEAERVALASLDAIGLPYDYGFSDENDMKYCFEVCGDAYKDIANVDLKRTEYKFLWFKPLKVYLSDTFTDDKLFNCKLKHPINT